MKTNKLGIEVTRPTQELIIMRGIPGAVEIKESTIHGKGVFAISKILKNTIFEIDIITIKKKRKFQIV